MKKAISSLVLLFSITFVCGQSISINETGALPDETAILDISSQDKGFLLPRMNSLERINIPSPQTGLLVYDLDLQSLFYFDGGQWVEFTSGKKGLRDTDFDTKVLVEQLPDDDTIRLVTAGNEKLKVHDLGINYQSELGNIYLGTGSKEVGTDNITIGMNTANQLHNLTSKSVFIGNESANELNSDLANARNTIIGYEAFKSVTTGNTNVAIGAHALTASESRSNISIGAFSGNLQNNKGNTNIFIGLSAGASTSGDLNNNIAIGSFAGRQLAGGSNNISIGQGGGNTGLVTNDGIFIGNGAASSMASCTGCIIIGENSGLANAFSSNILMIDNEATSYPLIFGDFSSDRVGFNGKVAIGDNFAQSDLHLYHGNNSDSDGFKIQNEEDNFWRFYVRSSNGNLRLYSKDGGLDYVAWVDDSSDAWNSTSDLRKKKDFDPLSQVLPSILDLEVLKYHFLTEDETDKKHIGLIAQEVEKYFPELVFYDEVLDLYTMNYDGFGPIALKGIQELSAENQKLTDLLKSQQSDIEFLKEELTLLKSKVEENKVKK